VRRKALVVSAIAFTLGLLVRRRSDGPQEVDSSPLSVNSPIQGNAPESKQKKNGQIGTVATLLTALSAAAAVFFTGLQFNTAEQGQVTDRFGRAVQQLGDGAPDVRIGGIYALERLANDSPGDQSSIVEILSAYVRDHTAPSRSSGCVRFTPTQVPFVGGLAASLTNDVEVALEVLGRRDRSQDGKSTEDLRNVCLSGFNLEGLNLSGVNLVDANISGADLSNSNLEGADISKADADGALLATANLRSAHLYLTLLRSANLRGADLSDAKINGSLSNADLSGAILVRTDFGTSVMTGAMLVDADVRGAKLEGAELSGARVVPRG
jgi:uncharacterized protein YjbI with pentapeptide repeats